MRTENGKSLIFSPDNFNPTTTQLLFCHSPIPYIRAGLKIVKFIKEIRILPDFPKLKDYFG